MLAFSVVIPNLHSTFIDRTLASLRAQDYDLSRVEVIVVGQDRHGLIREDDLVCFDQSPDPLPPAVARNRGMEQASGDVVALLDADCLASPTWLNTLARRYQDAEAHIVGGGVSFPSGNYWTICDNLSWFYEVLTDTPAGTRSHLPTLNLSLRREVFETVGGMDESFPRPAGEDTEWTTRMRLAGYELYFEPQAIVYHHHSRNTLKQVLDHAFHYGYNSVKVDPRYASTVGLPALLRNPLILRIVAPVLGTGATARVFLKYGASTRHLQTVPAIFLTKLSWCLGAAQRLGDEQSKGAKTNARG